MKTIRILTTIATVWLAVSAQHVAADEVMLAKLEDLKSSLQLSLRADIKIEGMKLGEGSKVVFKSDSMMTVPSLLMRSGDKGTIEIIKEYEVANIDDRPFEGLKFTLRPNFDFVTGKVINSGKLVISKATRIGNVKLENSIETASHDFKSWSKHWSAVGDQNLTLKIDEKNSIKISIKWTAVSPTGKTLLTKQGEQGVAPQSATRAESKPEGNDKLQPESEERSR